MRQKSPEKNMDLILSGIQVFALNSFECAKIVDIAKGAKMSAGSFYLYYTDKTILLESIFELIYSEICQGLKGLDPTNPRQFLIDAIRSFMMYFIDRPSRAMVYLNEYPRLLRKYPLGIPCAQKCMEGIAPILQHGIQIGVLKPLPPHWHISMFGALRGNIQYFLSIEKIDLQEIEDHIELMARMLVNDCSHIKAVS